MKHELTELEARVIGCLLEKQVTTPDQYPLSLNALTAACNQKNNRNPVLALSEVQVQAVVDGLMRKSLVMEKSGFGSRVPKYQQRICNLEFSELQFSAQELAIVCDLLLRGPQTPGELRTRAARMAAVRDVGDVEAALNALAGRQPHPLVVRLPREAGHRDARWAQLLTGPAAGATIQGSAAAAGGAEPAALPDAPKDRLAQLEAEVRDLRRVVDELRQAVAAHLVGKPAESPQ
jgi:uncharacterized protein